MGPYSVRLGGSRSTDYSCKTEQLAMLSVAAVARLAWAKPRKQRACMNKKKATRQLVRRRATKCEGCSPLGVDGLPPRISRALVHAASSADSPMACGDGGGGGGGGGVAAGN